MVSRINDHPRESGGVVTLSEDQFERLCELLKKDSPQPDQVGTVRIHDDQMDELRELLKPGHKMASIMIEQHMASQESQYGGENAGSMDPGPQVTGESKPGTDASGDGGAPDLDDASKQGGG